MCWNNLCVLYSKLKNSEIPMVKIVLIKYIVVKNIIIKIMYKKVDENEKEIRLE